MENERTDAPFTEHWLFWVNVRRSRLQVFDAYNPVSLLKQMCHHWNFDLTSDGREVYLVGIHHRDIGARKEPPWLT